MQLKSLVFTLLCVMVLFSCKPLVVAEYNKGINIIPVPLKMNETNLSPFKLSAKTTISAEGEEAALIAKFFTEKISLSTGYAMRMSEGQADIVLSINGALDVKNEGYSLDVSTDKISVVGKDAAGLFYGMQTLLQLLPAEVTSKTMVTGVAWSVPTVSIKDEPRFAYRGIMLDACRHFMPVEFVKTQLDIFAMFKINRMHWHLTEDQAWRVEIKKYPKLTEVGATRIEGEGFEYSGFYTQQDIKDIVAYAAERHITVIPEFELPGHELAAIAAYPELSCQSELDKHNKLSNTELTHYNKPITPRIIWGVEDIVMCPANDLTFRFIEDVIDEMTALFPSEYFHIGGDECPKTSWANCPKCQQFICDHNLQAKDGHTAEERLQSYIIHRVEQMLAERGKRLIGWDEILEGGLSPEATVMSWRGEEGGIAAANMGHDVIMTPNPLGMYIDHYQGDYRIEPVAIGGYTTLERTYSYDPMPQRLKDEGKEAFVLGVQANLWTEYMYTTSLMEYRLYPRALAVAEIGWSELGNKNFTDFSRRVENAYVRLDSYDINYHIPQPEQPLGSVNNLAFHDDIRVEFTTTRPIKMVYTLDGSVPTPESSEYTEPFYFTESKVLKIRSVLPSGKMSTVREIVIEKQEYSPAVSVEEPTQGLRMKTVKGSYLNMEALAKSTVAPVESVISRVGDVAVKTGVGESIKHIENVANIAEGYLDIPCDGVYYFWTNNNEFWIDSKLLISNDNEVKRFSRNSKAVALAKGLHPIKIVWLSNIIGGWPTNWDDGNIKIRREGDKGEINIAPTQIFY